MRLLIPGPVDIDDDVLCALGSPVTPHYGLDWGAMFVEMLGQLKQVFRADGNAFAIPGSGSTGLDAAIGNMLSSGQRAIVCANGYFGNRLCDICASWGIEVIRVEAVWGTAINPDDVRAAFKQAGNVDALIAVHVETSTGVINPIREIAAIGNAHGAAVIVDAITALGATELDVSGWGIDVCISGSQKAIAAPAGFALLAVTKRAWARMESHPAANRGWYMNLRHWREYAEEVPPYHPHPVTVPPGNTRALNLQLQKILAMGLDNYIARHARAAARFRSGLTAIGQGTFVSGEAAAPALSVVAVPVGKDMRGIVNAMRERYGLYISGGFGGLDGKILRIGHMGKASSDEYVDAALAALGELL
jgi:aspartate aminotransferase-like enzyme